MDRPLALLPLAALLTLCITAGTPDVWMRVEMEAESLSFTVHCGFLGSGSLSLVTVSCGKSETAQGTKLAVLSPESGTWHWDPDCQARWETRSSISLTLKGSEGRSLSPNTTFCCKFVSFPEGSQEACGSSRLSTDPGLPAPSPASGLRADLAGIWGVTGALLLGCIYLLHLLYRQRHRWEPPAGPATPQHTPGSLRDPQLLHSQPRTPQQVRAASRTFQTSFPLPSASLSTKSCFPTALHAGPWALPPPPPPATRAALYATARGRFVSVENGLYVRMDETSLISFLDPLGPRAGHGNLGELAGQVVATPVLEMWATDSPVRDDPAGHKVLRHHEGLRGDSCNS
ncbi:transmembrane protein PVRIG [Sorex fumeus]|uniref:transmembrane protein PVRIG n=1 Tax=Sorex fumeus TaxID=62283 RepID=UPI0024AD38D6|nr:transmembrane protein PVRIG [Sorex fumeus]